MDRRSTTNYHGMSYFHTMKHMYSSSDDGNDEYSENNAASPNVHKVIQKQHRTRRSRRRRKSSKTKETKAAKDHQDKTLRMTLPDPSLSDFLPHEEAEEEPQVLLWNDPSRSRNNTRSSGASVFGSSDENRRQSSNPDGNDADLVAEERTSPFYHDELVETAAAYPREGPSPATFESDESPLTLLAPTAASKWWYDWKYWKQRFFGNSNIDANCCIPRREMEHKGPSTTITTETTQASMDKDMTDDYYDYYMYSNNNNPAYYYNEDGHYPYAQDQMQASMYQYQQYTQNLPRQHYQVQTQPQARVSPLTDPSLMSPPSDHLSSVQPSYFYPYNQQQENQQLHPLIPSYRQQEPLILPPETPMQQRVPGDADDNKAPPMQHFRSISNVSDLYDSNHSFVHQSHADNLKDSSGIDDDDDDDIKSYASLESINTAWLAASPLRKEQSIHSYNTIESERRLSTRSTGFGSPQAATTSGAITNSSSKPPVPPPRRPSLTAMLTTNSNRNLLPPPPTSSSGATKPPLRSTSSPGAAFPLAPASSPRGRAYSEFSCLTTASRHRRGGTVCEFSFEASMVDIHDKQNDKDNEGDHEDKDGTRGRAQKPSHVTQRSPSLPTEVQIKIHYPSEPWPGAERRQLQHIKSADAIPEQSQQPQQIQLLPPFLSPSSSWSHTPPRRFSIESELTVEEVNGVGRDCNDDDKNLSSPDGYISPSEEEMVSVRDAGDSSKANDATDLDASTPGDSGPATSNPLRQRRSSNPQESLGGQSGVGTCSDSRDDDLSQYQTQQRRQQQKAPQPKQPQVIPFEAMSPLSKLNGPPAIPKGEAWMWQWVNNNGTNGDASDTRASETQGIPAVSPSNGSVSSSSSIVRMIPKKDSSMVIQYDTYLPKNDAIEHVWKEQHAASGSNVVVSGWMAFGLGDSLREKLLVNKGTLEREDISYVVAPDDSGKLFVMSNSEHDTTDQESSPSVVDLSGCRAEAQEISREHGRAVIVKRNSTGETVCILLPVGLPSGYGKCDNDDEGTALFDGTFCFPRGGYLPDDQQYTTMHIVFALDSLLKRASLPQTPLWN